MKLRTDVPAPDTKHVNLECYNCNNVFAKTLSEYKRGIKGTRSCMFCSYKCSVEFKRNNLKRFKTNCNNCGKEVDRGEHQKTESGNYYCSHSCSAIKNNHLHIKCNKKQTEPVPKGDTKKTCSCGRNFSSALADSCKVCLKQTLHSQKTLGCCKKQTADGQPKNILDPIRFAAKDFMRAHHAKKQCAYCGYNKIVEVCHIKSIASFDDSAAWTDINCLSNLIYLCPNHHKELDVLRDPDVVTFVARYSKGQKAVGRKTENDSATPRVEI